MSEQVLIQFRADKALKQKGAEIYETTLPENTITRAEAKKAFYDLREQAAENAVEKIKYS